MDFFNIEGKQLDSEQIEAATYIGNQLVIAGAGAGKTLTIVGKVKYLLEKCNVPVDEILVLAFTDKVVAELIERIKSVTPKKIDVLTFHKLGMRVFQTTENEKTIEENSVFSYLQNYFNKGEYEKDTLVASGIYHFIKEEYGDDTPVDSNEIHKITEALNGYSFKMDKTGDIKSLIACNMLYELDIPYEFVYPNKYGAYIILNKNIKIKTMGKPYGTFNYDLSKINYKDMPKKLSAILKENNYDNIEFSNYSRYLPYAKEVKLFKELIDNLIRAQRIASAADAYNDDIDNLIDTYCNKDEESKMFFEILKWIRLGYSKYLNETYQTDFNYMISGPVEILRRCRCFNYKYLIVDEYQDISPARYNLLVEIMRQNNGYIMAFGDDWQSIYSFSGSNNKFFMDFTKNIPDAKQFYLKNTYRNSQQLIDASTHFVMQNPCQKDKEIKSNKLVDQPINILNYEVSNLDSLVYCIYQLSLINKPVTLLVLGRTNYSISILKKMLELLKTTINEKNFYYYDGFPTVYLEFMTIHRSKGLEADYVFITGVNYKQFPLNNAYKKPYIKIIQKMNEYEEEKEHERYEGLPNSEERRLFYVALTRTKNSVFISAPDNGWTHPSKFIDDIMAEDKPKIRNYYVNELYEFDEAMKCPFCNGLTYSVKAAGRNYTFCENNCYLGSTHTDNSSFKYRKSVNAAKNIIYKIKNMK